MNIYKESFLYHLHIALIFIFVYSKFNLKQIKDVYYIFEKLISFFLIYII